MLCIQSYNLFMDLDGSLNRFSYTAQTNCKMRIFTEREVRDNWTAGVNAFYNRVNPHTGVNILQDPPAAAGAFTTRRRRSSVARWPGPPPG